MCACPLSMRLGFGNLIRTHKKIKVRTHYGDSFVVVVGTV